MAGKTAMYLSVFLLVAAVAVSAGDYKTAEQTTKGEQQMFEGTLVCQGCDLKKTEGARAACTTFGHKHALKTEEGKYISFLENQYSADLITGEKYHNKKVAVQGIYFANANLIDVETFAVDGSKKGWCGGCSKMDGCSVASK